MIRTEICYTSYHMKTQTVAHNISGFQGIKCCIQYLDSHSHKPIFYPYNSYDVSDTIRLICIGNKVEY